MARMTEESMAGQLRALKVGQSYSRTKRIPLQGEEAPDPSGVLPKLRNLINQAVSRLRVAEPGSYFRVESATALTDNKEALLVTVAVTRMEAADPNDEEADI